MGSPPGAQSVGRLTPETPRAQIGLVVLNYFGEDRTLRLLDHVQELTWPRDHLRIALVDNGSAPGFRQLVADRFPDVTYVASETNVGFGGGCNLGILALEGCEHIALLNNDATPAPNWLEPLVAALDEEDDLGAVTPKVVLASTYVRVTLRSATSIPGRGDTRSLGVQVCGARVGDVDVSDRIELARGCWGWEADATTVGGAFAWTSTEAVLLVPVDAGAEGATVQLRLACALERRVVTVEHGQAPASFSVEAEPTWHDIGPALGARDVINNVGTVLLEDGQAADRGYLELDEGQFDESSEVFGWSGAAVLIRRRFLEDVGLFDERFFLYYEDTELSWRGRLHGWRYRLVPESVVRHEHSATVGARSRMAQHLSVRNRLLMLALLAPPRLARSAVGDVLRDLATAVRRDVLVRLVAGRRPVLQHVSRDARVLAAFGAKLPWALRARRDRRRGAVDDDAVLRWAVRTTDAAP